MAKKSIIQRSIKKFLIKQKYFYKRKYLKTTKKSCLNLLSSFKIQKSFQKFPKNSSQTRFKRFCWKTGRNRGFFRDFNLSRHSFREMSHNGVLPGLTKSSW
uniref:Ribosomal protein S14 n=1 Tax=Pteridomonas sp. YPF1301 TaxID=2766739 RepID=A0A7G1MPP2_9STRA|nr:ribosomal protein S14 [Pteridomonas sp. YPF1301]